MTEKESAREQLKLANEYVSNITSCYYCRIVMKIDEECSHPYGIKTRRQMDYACQYCSYLAPRRDGLNGHIMRKHLGPEYECDLCSYKAFKTSDWKRHRVLQHSEVKIPCN